MLSLSQAFRLCNIQEHTSIYFRSSNESSSTNTWSITAKIIRQKMDMKAIKVTRIEPWFSYDGFEGLVFTVPSLSDEAILRLAHNI